MFSKLPYVLPDYHPYDISIGIQSSDEAYPLCFIHFQGKEMKQLMIVYLRALSNILDIHQYGYVAGSRSDGIPAHNMSFIRPIITPPLNSRALISFNSTDNKQYYVQSMKNFNDDNFYIVPYVPGWLLYAFPDGGIMPKQM